MPETAPDSPRWIFSGKLTEAGRSAARAELSVSEWELLHEHDGPLRAYRLISVEEMREAAPRPADDDRVARRTFSWEPDGTPDGLAGDCGYFGWPAVETRQGKHRAP